MELFSKRFKEDPRILEAKQLVQKTIQEYQQHFTKPKSADPEKKVEYERLLQEFSKLRGSELFFPYLGSGFGNGCLVELLDGSIKYDFASGIGPHYWGHNHPKITEAAFDASLSDIIMQGNLQQNKEALEISKLLTDASKLDHCFLTNSGSMANENALKIIFQKKFPACRILAFERCFMGRTITFSQITDKPAYREGLPQNIFVDYVPFFDSNFPEESTRHAVEVLTSHLRRHPGQYAAMCFELVQGEGGFYKGDENFFKTLIKILKEHNIAVFIDEIQTFGRTEQLFAFQYFNLQQEIDVVTIGKLSQVCATLFTKEYNPKPGLLSQTFISSTSALYAGIAIIRELLEGNFFGPEGKIAQIYRIFHQRFEKFSHAYPALMRGSFGIGAMIAMTPFDGNKERVVKFVKDLFEAGVITFIAGANPTRVRFLIPIGAITQHDIDQALTIVEDVLLRGP